MLTLIAALVLYVIAMLSYIWLIVVGFKKHVLWGIGIIFIPFVFIIFPIMNWDRAKKPFLITMISSILMIALMFEPMMQVANESVQVAQQVQRGEITEQQGQEIIQKRLIQIFSGEQGTPVITNDDLLTPEEQRIETLREELRIKNEAALASQKYAEEQAQKEAVVEEKRRKVKVFSPIKISEAKNYVGKKIRVVSFEGVERQGILLSAGFDRLSVDRKLAGGGFKFDVLTKDIKTIEVQKIELR